MIKRLLSTSAILGLLIAAAPVAMAEEATETMAEMAPRAERYERRLGGFSLHKGDRDRELCSKQNSRVCRRSRAWFVHTNDPYTSARRTQRRSGFVPTQVDAAKRINTDAAKVMRNAKDRGLLSEFNRTDVRNFSRRSVRRHEVMKSTNFKSCRADARDERDTALRNSMFKKCFDRTYGN